MYDFIYPKIEEECLITHLLQKCSQKKCEQVLNLPITNFRTKNSKYEPVIKQKANLDFGISLPPMLLKIFYGVRDNVLALM